MTRTTPAGESWSAWLRHWLANREWRQSDLIAAMNTAGYDVARQTVSKWLKAENAADPNLAAAVASVLGANPGDALRAAGYGPAVDLLVGTGAGVEPESKDRGLASIKARNLPPDREAKVIARYRQRMELLLEDLSETLDILAEARNGTNSPKQDDSRPA